MHSFRVVTYNIHKARGMDGRVNIERILRVLRELEPDIVALQEVVNHENRAPEEHQACYLADQLGLHYTVGETRRHREAAYGNATLSRWKFERVHKIDLSVPGREPRGALRTDIRVGSHLVHVVNVHLGTAMHERKAQARLIDEHLLKAIDVSGPRIVLGDFNDWTHGLVTKTLCREFHLTDLARHLPRTRAYPALLPLVHLDHIYFDHHLSVERAHFHRNRTSLLASDHLPLSATFSFHKAHERS
jgi:endonuclease/exonuclease/phosphatase family metal-dependent hydrolase